MKRLNVLLTCFAIITASGCSHFYALSSDLNTQIDRWLADDEYQKIEETLKHISTKHAEYKTIDRRRSEITRKKNNYIKSTLASSQKLRDSGKWQTALETLNDALDKLPGNKKLLKERNALISERDLRINELRKHMLIRKARALIQYEPIYNNLNQLIPNDYEAKSEIDDYNEDRAELADLLMSCSNHALESSDYYMAAECLSLSNQLVKTRHKTDLLKTTLAKRKTIDDKRKSKHLLNLYQQAYEKKDYHNARYNLEILSTIKPDDKKIQKLKADLEKEIQFLLEHDINQGKTLYSSGKISEALAIWENLLNIDPDNNELIALITRAKKVTQKLQELEESATSQ
jgi:tetratricopeptide (TPR) repeat protein